MFQECLLCKRSFFECDLLEQRCIECWRQIAGHFAQGYEKECDVEEAFRNGYTQTHEYIVDRNGDDVLTLKNPYSAQDEPRKHGAWLRGRDSRFGAYQHFLRQQREKELVTA